jgi:tRNA-Thr(GGU) m(6)t(6)A37 methyltransferase TsaA
MSHETGGESESFAVVPIGWVRRSEKGVHLQIEQPYRNALVGLSEFSHAIVLWWFDRFDNPAHRNTTRVKPPFDAPELGVFSLKAPTRPNPIALTTVKIEAVDVEAGRLTVHRIDAYDGTPVLDVKGYMPAVDRVRSPSVPSWAAGWPEWMPDKGLDVDRMPEE